MRQKIFIDNDWLFRENYDSAEEVSVRIPHTGKELPYHYFDENEYQLVCGYRRTLNIPSEYRGQRVAICFDGVAHYAEVRVNGQVVGTHNCGYTAFKLDISDVVKYGEDNEIDVKVDSRETLNFPPFGFVVDYLTYSGIYRDVYLEVTSKTYISDVFAKGKNGRLESDIKVSGDCPGMKLKQFIRKYGDTSYIELGQCNADNEISMNFNDSTWVNWDIENPALYELKTELLDSAGNSVDEVITKFGFRDMEFRKDGFYLNGKKVKIRGLNRHQSYAYVGYAMPKSMQVRDADIMKYELGLNAARTSHYPQSHYFIDRCDEIGLLVFTEFPGWQHIGDAAWKDQAVKNAEDMILQYRNHPSIMLWGVRINESVDDKEFYERTNAAAHRLDPTRQTGGVRCYKKGDFQEDVFTYNDFVHNGKNIGAEPPKNVTPDTEKPYLISEYNGHMYPTKAFDWEEHRQEHALRHARVLDEVMKQPNISGSFGWCMFDYNTHKDFGSGDKICYHGVMDMFRNPKMASAVYAAQSDEAPVLEIGSTMDIGEHPGCNRGNVYIFTNADTVRMYKNDELVKEYRTSDSPFRNMKHGPILLDDYVGDALEKGEGMPKKQADKVKELLNSVARTGLYGLSKGMYLKAMWLILRYRMSMSQAVTLFNKYVGDWGGASKVYRFEAVKDGRVVKTVLRGAMKSKSIEADVSSVSLKEDQTYDVAAVRIRAVDENGNILNFANDPVELETEGDIELIGPSVISLNGGMFGTYVKTIGRAGSGKLHIKSPWCETKTIEFTINK